MVDVYSAWCGPCKAVISLFRRVKNELGDNLLRFAVVSIVLVCMYMYMYMYVYVCTCTCMYMYMYMYMHVYMYEYVCT